MKSHEQKMAEKKEHEIELERNDLNAWMMSFWTRLKSGQLVTRKFATWAILIGAAIGLAIYLTRGTRNTQTAAWRSLENTTGLEALKDYAKDAPDTIQGKVARLQVARQLLGVQGLAQLNHVNPDTRGKAIRAVAESREMFSKLIEDFKDDPTLRGQAIDGAAHAELALVGIPREGEPADSTVYQGSVEKAIELFRSYAKLMGGEAAEAATKFADQLEANKQDVVKLGKFINTKLIPEKREEIKLPPSLTPSAPPPGPGPVPPPEPKK